MKCDRHGLEQLDCALPVLTAFGREEFGRQDTAGVTDGDAVPEAMGFPQYLVAKASMRSTVTSRRGVHVAASRRFSIVRRARLTAPGSAPLLAEEPLDGPPVLGTARDRPSSLAPDAASCHARRVGKRSELRAAVLRSTRRYERMASRSSPVVATALRLKHERMAESAFAYFRATFYRWVELWNTLCPELSRAPKVLAIGDLHVENFGTWRDAEGRLAWGVNDFDEAYPTSYAIDLVRLAASATLSSDESELTIRPKDACDAILEGYTASLRAGGEPFVLAARHPWLRDIAMGSARDPARFWTQMSELPRFRGALPRAVTRALERLFPGDRLEYARRTRVAGLGSLGRVRMVALAWFEGAQIAREAKALAPSALATGASSARRIWYREALARSVRAHDPFVRVEGAWLLRRLAPDCARVELSDLPAKRDEERLLRNMGWETANVHLGTPGARGRILRHLAAARPRWLRDAARRMADAVADEAAVWRRYWRR